MAKLTTQIGGYTAIIEVNTPGVARLSWLNGDGKTLKAAPKLEGDDNQKVYQDIKKKFASIKQTLRVQTSRIESFFIEGFKTSIDEWRKYYIDHKLINSISASLIWSFEVGDKAYSAIVKDNTLLMADGSTLDNLPSNTLVSLWHPLQASASECEAWRNYVWRHAIIQPFRQAFREVYVARTDGHNPLNIDGLYVRQHQFRALLLSRGWSYQLRGSYDSDSTPMLKLKEGLSCEIGIAGTSSTYSDLGISLAVELEQITFMQQGKILSPCELSPIVFSEVMRDIDLFTSVAGLGYREDWEQIEATFRDVRESELIAKMAKSKEQVSLICNGLILDEHPFKAQIAKFLCALDISMAKLPIPETVKVRSQLLSLMLRGSKVFDKSRIEGRYVHIDTNEGGCIINLASGLVFNAKDNRLMPISAKRKAIANEAGSDTLLARIYSLVFMLASG